MYFVFVFVFFTSFFYQVRFLFIYCSLFEYVIHLHNFNHQLLCKNVLDIKYQQFHENEKNTTYSEKGEKRDEAEVCIKLFGACMFCHV